MRKACRVFALEFYFKPSGISGRDRDWADGDPDAVGVDADVVALAERMEQFVSSRLTATEAALRRCAESVSREPLRGDESAASLAEFVVQEVEGLRFLLKKSRADQDETRHWQSRAALAETGRDEARAALAEERQKREEAERRVAGWKATAETYSDDCGELAAQLAAERARAEAAEAKLREVDSCICWGVDCVHLNKALDMLYSGEEHNDALKAERDAALARATRAEEALREAERQREEVPTKASIELARRAGCGGMCCGASESGEGK